MIPSDIKWDPNATPPQFTNNEDTTIEPGTHVRVKIIGTRTEVGEMWAIGSIKEDYLGYDCVPLDKLRVMLTMIQLSPRLSVYQVLATRMLVVSRRFLRSVMHAASFNATKILESAQECNDLCTMKTKIVSCFFLGM